MPAPSTLNLSGTQARSLQNVLEEYNDGDGVFITQQGDTVLVVAFSITTVLIKPGGQSEEV